jgi:hypothetical protein
VVLLVYRRRGITPLDGTLPNDGKQQKLAVLNLRPRLIIRSLNVEPKTQEGVFTMKTLTKIVALLMAIAITASCVGPFDGSSEGGGGNSRETAQGSIKISIGGGVSAQSLVPDQPLDVDHYVINGAGPNGASFGPTTINADSPTQEISGLQVGQWTITISAFNENQLQRGFGMQVVTVVAGQSTEVNLTVAELTEDGTLNLQAEWPTAEELGDVQLTAQLVTNATVVNLMQGNPQSAGSWDYSGNHAPGFYTLSMTLSVGDTVIWGVVESVRIASNANTTGNMVVEADDLNTDGLEGDIDVIVDDEVPGDTPFNVELEANGSVVTATPDRSGDYTYTWFVQGQQVGGNQQSIDIANFAEGGSYNVSVVVSDGNFQASESMFVTVHVTAQVQLGPRNDGGFSNTLNMHSTRAEDFLDGEEANVRVDFHTDITAAREAMSHMFDLGSMIQVDIRVTGNWSSNAITRMSGTLWQNNGRVFDASLTFANGAELESWLTPDESITDVKFGTGSMTWGIGGKAFVGNTYRDEISGLPATETMRIYGRVKEHGFHITTNIASQPEQWVINITATTID